MTTINDLLTVTITIQYNGINTDNGQDMPEGEYYEETFGVGEDDLLDDPIVALTEIASAIEEGNLYGWMQQAMINNRIAAGDLRAETTTEMFARCAASHQTDTSAPNTKDNANG